MHPSLITYLQPTQQALIEYIKSDETRIGQTVDCSFVIPYVAVGLCDYLRGISIDEVRQYCQVS